MTRLGLGKVSKDMFVLVEGLTSMLGTMKTSDIGPFIISITPLDKELMGHTIRVNFPEKEE